MWMRNSSIKSECLGSYVFLPKNMFSQKSILLSSGHYSTALNVSLIIYCKGSQYLGVAAPRNARIYAKSAPDPRIPWSCAPRTLALWAAAPPKPSRVISLLDYNFCFRIFIGNYPLSLLAPLSPHLSPLLSLHLSPTVAPLSQPSWVPDIG